MKRGAILLPCMVCDRPTESFALIGGAALLYLCDEHRTYDRAREWAQFAADSERRREAEEDAADHMAAGDG